MMRTIQHPGVQIQESEIGGYKSTIVMNNAYIIGFTDKGPTYDYSFITTTSEFTNLYGEPQSEAEKYLFTAVKSVLSNGGTPIVARMPYDNKQCKAYKALKMSWQKDEKTKSVIANLKDVADSINEKQTFAEIFENSNLTLKQAAELLNPYNENSELYDDITEKELAFNINGVAPSSLGVSRDAVKKLVDAITSDNEERPIVVNAYSDSMNEIYAENSIDASHRFVNRNDTIYKMYKNAYIVLNGLVSGEFENTAISLVNEGIKEVEIDDTIYSVIPCDDSYNFQPSFKAALLASTELSGIVSKPAGKRSLISSSASYEKFISSAELSGKLNVIDADFIGYFDEDVSKAGQLYRTTYNGSLIFDKSDEEYTKIAAFSGITLKKVDNIDTKLLSMFIENNPESEANEQIATINVCPLTGEYNTTVSSFINKSNAIKTTITYAELSSVFNTSVLNALGIQFPTNLTSETTFEILNAIPAGYTDVKDGTKTVTTKYIHSYTLDYKVSLDSVKAKYITEDLVKANEYLVRLNVIYNDPAFINMNDETVKALDAKLLNSKEMGFNNCLYLASDECEITNDQYDKLATVRKFSNVEDLSKYGQDISDANFIIIDKQKSVVQGDNSNLGYFTTIIDMYDALKVQRTLTYNSSNITTRNVGGIEFNIGDGTAEESTVEYWSYKSANNWNTIYENILDSMDCLEHVRNADGTLIGENSGDDTTSIIDSWSIPLADTYYNESISKELMKKFPAIPMADISSDTLNDDSSIIDHSYSSHICVVVCATSVDPSNNKIYVVPVESWTGSLFNERNQYTGKSQFIGDAINENSEYIEFYRNDFVKSLDDAYLSENYRYGDVSQVYIKNSTELKNAAQLCGIDYEGKDSENEEALAELRKHDIYVIDKSDTCIYNIMTTANFTSFSKKESQKIIANTEGLTSATGLTINVAANFLVDMDRCIKFIKNIDDVPLHFVCDAGLTTIAQFCDNVTWNKNKKTIVSGRTVEATGGWVTQPFDPDNDPDAEDRVIEGYSSITTWRKVAEKLISIASEIRKDCFVIIDAPRQLTLDGAAPKIRRSQIDQTFDKEIGKCLRYITGFNTSYAAGYYNWLRTTDQYTGKAIWIPPTSKIIGNYCYLNINNLPWLAPAGSTYGVVTGCYAVSHNPDAKEEDQIYMKSWNYIKQYPLEGLIVEGQRTLLGKESVFERINVRLLFLDLERFAYNVSRSYKYTVNNYYTREQFVSTLKPKFQDYTLRGGIQEYLIKVDDENNTPETIDNNELRGDIIIKPARLIEFILLNFVGTSSNINFSEVQLSANNA